jgi:GT2 family glycosyltransferase
MNDKNIFIVIPVHDRKQFTRQCLLSLRRQTLQNFTVIVIDDRSTDGTGEMIEKEFPEVILLKGDGNLWWTRATNLGVKYALESGAAYILTLNNDTMATEDFLEKMMRWADITPNALLGSLALDVETKSPVYGGEIINWKWASSKFLLDILNKGQWNGLHEVTHFPGRGLLIPVAVFEKIGLYDEKNFPHYAADYDFTHKAIRTGFKVYCNFDAKLFIYPDASGAAENRKKKSLKNYYTHLFGIKGGGNVKRFALYSMKNCPKRYRLQYIIIASFKVIFGYWIK